MSAVGETLLRGGLRSIFAVIAVVAVGFALKSSGTQAARVANDWWQGDRPVISTIPTVQLKNINLPAPAFSQIPDNAGVRVANLGPGIATQATATENRQPSKPSALFEERFFFEEPLVSFDDRFSGTSMSLASVNVVMTELVALGWANITKTEPSISVLPDPANQIVQLAVEVAQPAAKAAPGRSARATASLNDGIDASETRRDSISSSDLDSRHTAIYDISARVLYLPDGSKLEAHSGLGSRLDDPRYINVKHEGPTPPNVYRLTLRERLFHGVRAIRLIPVGGGNMFGRDGMLAHTYMLGPNGQSNGCVSIADYTEFLSAYLKGDIDHLVVVERLENPPSPTIASGWFTDTMKRLFKPFERIVALNSEPELSDTSNMSQPQGSSRAFLPVQGDPAAHLD